MIFVYYRIVPMQTYHHNMRIRCVGTGINFPPSAVEGENWMKYALEKLMGDCVAGIFLPPLWREETEWNTRYVEKLIGDCVYQNAMYYSTTIL